MNFLNKLKKTLLNPDVKVLVDNFISLSLLNVVGYVFPILTLPYLARVIGVEKFGLISLSAAMMVYFQTITEWGFSFTATRDIARNRENIEDVSRIFSRVMYSKFVLLISSFLFLLVLITCFDFFSKISSLLLVSFLLVVGNVLFPQWLFQGLERMRFITILNVLSKLLFTIAVFVFIKDQNDYILQPLFTSLGFISAGLISLYIIIVKWKIRFVKVPIIDILQTLKGSFDVFLNQLMPNMYNSFSSLLLGYWGGNTSLGILDAGSKFIGLGQQLMQIISRVFFPYLSRKSNKHSIFAKYTLISALVVSIFVFILSPFIIKLFFTEEFYNAIVVLKIMSFSIFFLALSNVYGVNYLIIKGEEKVLRNTTFIASLIGLIISFPLVYCYDYIGAAITVTFTRGLLGTLVYFRSKQYKLQ